MEQYPIVMASSPELHRQDPSPDTLAPCHDEDPADYVRDFVARLIDQATNDLCTCDSPWPTKAELFFDSPESTYPACLRRAVLITQYLTCAAKCLRDFETFSGGLDFMIWEARQYAPCRYTDHDVMELLEYNINDVWRASRFAQLTRLLYPSRRQAWIGGENEFMAQLDPQAVPTLWETLVEKRGPLYRALFDQEAQDLQGFCPGDGTVAGLHCEGRAPSIWRWRALVIQAEKEFEAIFRIMGGMTTHELRQADQEPVGHHLVFGLDNPPTIQRNRPCLMRVPGMGIGQVGDELLDEELVCRDACGGHKQSLAILAGEWPNVAWRHAHPPPLDDASTAGSLTGGRWGFEPDGYYSRQRVPRNRLIDWETDADYDERPAWASVAAWGDLPCFEQTFDLPSTPRWRTDPLNICDPADELAPILRCMSVAIAHAATPTIQREYRAQGRGTVPRWSTNNARPRLAEEVADHFVLTFLGPSYLWRRREALRRDKEFEEFDMPSEGAAHFHFEHRFAEFHHPSFYLTGATVPTPPPSDDDSDEDVMFRWDDLVYVHQLRNRTDLNNRTAVVIKDQRSDGRVGVRMSIGEETVWIHAEKLLLIHAEAALNRVPFNRMSGRERNAALLFLLANKGSVRIPGAPGIRLMSTSIEGNTATSPFLN